MWKDSKSGTVGEVSACFVRSCVHNMEIIWSRVARNNRLSLYMNLHEHTPSSVNLLFTNSVCATMPPSVRPCNMLTFRQRFNSLWGCKHSCVFQKHVNPFFLHVLSLGAFVSDNPKTHKSTKENKHH